MHVNSANEIKRRQILHDARELCHLKLLLVAAIGAEHCSIIAATHQNGALRNCPALCIIIMELLGSEHGTIESQHAAGRLATLDVTPMSVDKWPAHAAFFAATTTITVYYMCVLCLLCCVC
jgi:hypothetical protein